MRQQLEQYLQVLADEKCAKAGRIAICSQNDTTNAIGPQELTFIAQQVLQRLDCAAVIVAEPYYPFPNFLLRRTPPELSCLIPHDSESKVSLHDIPLVRKGKCQSDLLDSICSALKKRKGVIVEGIGMISHSSLTIEQAYISWSSLLHATTIKFFEDLLSMGPKLTEEHDFIASYKTMQLTPLTIPDTISDNRVPVLPTEILAVISLAGKSTVQLGLVDSFFGNISYATKDTLYISQTSARLDQLARQIDTIPFDGSSTAGITASSELPAHHAIIKATGCRAVLHGHPRFPVVMSFFTTSSNYKGIDLVGEFPVVDGEGGTGGLAETLPRAFCLTGSKAVVVRGHGVFAISCSGFREALTALIGVEEQCRSIYFSMLRNEHML